MNNKNKKIIDLVVKIVLIIIIIILLIHNCVINKNKSIEKIPTGNVDIIEIKCDKENVCEFDSNNKSTGKDTKQETTSVNGEEDIIREGMVTVYDNDVTWHGMTQAKIFTNSMYQIEDVIAPESSNTYQFVVKNSADFKLKYNINFIEKNPYNINMKYKLKKNDTYLVNHYVSASELNLTNLILNSSDNDTYYLEWKWVSSDNDTQIGKEQDAKYGLNIEVRAESTND